MLLSFFLLPISVEEERLPIPDRGIIERLTRLEEGHKALREQMTASQANLQVQINGLRDLILGGFAVMFAGIFALIDFVIWDRRTALSPVISKTKELEEREDLTCVSLRNMPEKTLRWQRPLEPWGCCNCDEIRGPESRPKHRYPLAEPPCLPVVFLEGMASGKDLRNSGVEPKSCIRNYRKCQFWQYRYFALPRP